SLSELIAATSSRRDSPEMTGANRRRLRALAREYQRPGSTVGDMHEALVRIQQQRLLWQRYVVSGVPPRVPAGIAQVQVAHQNVFHDLASREGPLGPRDRDDELVRLPIPELLAKLAGLAADSDALANLQERTELRVKLQDLQLDPLLTDLSARHVPEDEVAAELELAWWQSALESLLEADRALLGANTG